MTGFSRSEGESAGSAWAWEIKSVNGKGLDARTRLPMGFERLEPLVRAQVQSRFKRGNVSLNLTLSQQGAQSVYKINWDVLDHVLEAIPEIRRNCPEVTPPSIHGLLGLRGVMETVDEKRDETQQAAFDAELLASLDDALDGLSQNRQAEGQRLYDMLDSHVGSIENLWKQAAKEADAQTALLRARIEQGVSALMEASPALPEDRLAQEAAVLFTKADIREELDRLEAHCAAARELLSADGAIGRKFDFLCQEFNREANTLCSKAVAPELTRVGLELKVVIDQLREQVQNVE